MASIEKRVSHTGGTTYRVKIRLKGFPTQSATFERLTDAKRWEQSTESAIREGRHFKTVEAKKHTLGDLIDRYIETVIPTKIKIGKKQASQLLWWKEAIGFYLLADLSPAIIAQCRDKLLTEQTKWKKIRSPATVNRYLAALSHAFTIAIKEWGWLEDNFVLKITKPKEARGRIRFLSEDERKRLLEASVKSSNKYLHTIIILAISTGARKNEILSLTWENVNLERRVIVLHDTKNGERRVLPIVGKALEILKEHKKIPRIDTKLLFPAKNPLNPIDIRNPWQSALEEAEIEDFRFHDLRHSAASYLAMSGASLAEIAEVLGHKTLQMVKRYAHLSEAHTASVVERMNNNIFG